MRAQEFISEGVDAKKVLQYVKRAHAPEQFDIEHSITDHPSWELKNIPVSQLKLDPEGEHQDPYGRVNWVDWDKVQDLLPNIGAVLKRMPIVVDSEGWIIDGNHRATAAAEAGLKSVPAYVPVKQNVAEAFNQPYPFKWEVYGEAYDALVKLDDGSNLEININPEYDEEGNEEWHVDFWRSSSIGVTGEGDAFRIFATVMAAMQDFIKREKPRRIVFTASKEVEPGQNSESRTDLYQRMVDRYARAWGFKVDVGQSGPNTVFTLTRGFGIRENMDHSKDGRAVEELRAALLARKEKLQAASDEQVYDIIDKIMTRIAKSHSISGQQLHDMWVDKYKQIPDTWIMNENFDDGKNPGRKGLAKRVGVNCKQSVSKLRSIAAHSSGERQRMAHWCANMKSGKKKANEEEEDFVGPYDGHNFFGAQIG